MTRVIIALFTLLAIAPAAAQDAQRSLENVTGDVWQFTNNAHQAAVVVADDGVVVTDPISAEAAEWLKAEIAQRFNKPITHLIYSHSHGDHASGGQVFGDVTAIAHENAPAAIDGVTVDTRISEPTEIAVGGKTLELVPLGPGHGNDMLVMIVRPENVAFVVDVVSPDRVPYQDMAGVDVDGLAKQIEAVEALDFDTMLPGHGRRGDKSDATKAGEYLDWLRGEVKAGLDAGKSVEEIKAGMQWGPYSDWAMVQEWGPMNVEGMARWLQQN
jgi:glyoxylase-like metal-dependent hydrolase (beta-lactamase superfamily II)